MAPRRIQEPRLRCGRAGLRIGPARLRGIRSPPTPADTACTAPGRLPGALRSRGVRVEVVGKDFTGLSVAEILERLTSMGVGSLLVEGGSALITSFLGSGMTDRLIVSIAPTVLGKGTEAVSDLGSARISDGIRLSNRSLVTVEDDLILAWDVDYAA